MATIFQCHPISRAWDRWSGSGTCVNLGVLWYANAIYNILTDFVIVLMVPPVIFKLQLPMRQKLVLACVFGLGVIVCAASISRLTTLYSSAYGDDITAGSLVSTIWTTIESGLGIVCANLPMLRTPLQHFFPHLFPSRTGTDRISSRRGSRPSCRNKGEALASPARLIAPPIPVRSVSLFGRVPAGIIDVPELPGGLELCEGPTKLHQYNQIAQLQDLEAQQRQFGHVGGQQPRSEDTETTDWYDHRDRVW